MSNGADVFVAFGGDTAALEASLARANSSIKATTAEMRKLADEMRKTGAASGSELDSRLQSAAGRLVEAKTAAASLKTELQSTGEQAIHAGAGFGYYSRELRALADKSASGRWRQFDGSLINLVAHGYQAAAAFAAVNPALTAVGVGALGAARRSAISFMKWSRRTRSPRSSRPSLAFSANADIPRPTSLRSPPRSPLSRA